MGRMKTPDIALAGALALLPLQAQALDLTREFATCTGRYSALVEHEWLMGTAGDGGTERRRDHFADLLAAVVPPGRAGAVMGWRIEAKAAQARLLQQAAFATAPAARDSARARAARLIAACDSLIPGA